MTTVKAYALEQLHWLMQKDPWVEAVMVAGGCSLDTMAERILAIYNGDTFPALSEGRCAYFERLLGLKGTGQTLEDRRSAIQAAWLGPQKPTMALIQSICDAWQKGGTKASYEPGVVKIEFFGSYGTPKNLSALETILTRTIPAHLRLVYAFQYLLVKEIHGVMTLSELEREPMDNFAAG